MIQYKFDTSSAKMSFVQLTKTIWCNNKLNSFVGDSFSAIGRHRRKELRHPDDELDEAQEACSAKEANVAA